MADYEFRPIGPEATAIDGLFTDFERFDPTKDYSVAELLQFITGKASLSSILLAVQRLVEKTYQENAEAGFSNLEVLTARGGYDNLNKRIESVINLIDAKLQEKKVGIEGLDLELWEIIKGDRPMPGAELGSIITEMLSDKAITGLKLADNYRMADNWITDTNATLENYTKDGNYMVDTKVADNPTKKLAMLNNETTKTLIAHNLLRVRQEITSVYGGTEKYFRTFTKNLDTGEITLKSEWVPIGMVNHITQAKDNFNAIAKTWTATNVDLNTIYQQGVHLINNANATNMPINQMGILKVNNAFASDNSTGSRFIEQTFTTLVEPVRSFKRTIFADPLNANFTDGYVRAWQEITNPIGNAWFGKKWVALGTSITARPINYANYVKDILGLQLENRGYSSGGLTTIAPKGNMTMQRAKEIEDFDGLLTVEMIPNDYGFPLGVLGDKTEDTFYGCLYTLADTLQKRTTARIVWIISTTAYTRADGTRRDVLSNVLTNGTWEMRKAVKEVGELFSIPVINAGGESGLGGWVQNSQTMADNIHHLELGAQIKGEYVAKQLTTIQPFPDTLNLASDITTA